MSEVKLPEGWVWKRLVDISTKIHYGYTASSTKEDTGTRLLRITDIQDNQVDWQAVPFCAIAAQDIDKYLLGDGDLLFARTGATVGKSYLIKGIIPSAVFASYLIRVILDKRISREFIYYFFHSSDYWQQIRSSSVGIGQPNVNGTILSQLRVPLPPLPVQQQIVARIEELFSELDAGVKELKTALARLKTYRQAVLHHYLNNPDWERVRLGEVCLIQRGKSKHRPRNDKRLFGGLYPFIQTGEVRAANGGAIKSFTQTYSEFGLKQSKLWPKGTLCLTIAANIGETAFLGFDACFPDSVVGVLPNQELINLQYVNHFVMSYKAYLDATAPATAQKNVNLEILDNILIPLPNLDTQAQIVSDIETRLSDADAMEATIRQELARAENLRQSILKQAFEGKLVTTPIDPAAAPEMAGKPEPVSPFYGSPSGDQLTLF